MEKIFYIDAQESKQTIDKNLDEVNKFIATNGHIVSVTANNVHCDNPSSMYSEVIRGSWLVVADDGKNITL